MYLLFSNPLLVTTPIPNTPTKTTPTINSFLFFIRRPTMKSQDKILKNLIFDFLHYKIRVNKTL